jgi:hypothetical protein
LDEGLAVPLFLGFVRPLDNLVRDGIELLHREFVEQCLDLSVDDRRFLQLSSSSGSADWNPPIPRLFKWGYRLECSIRKRRTVEVRR